MERIAEDEVFLWTIFFSNQATFNLCGKAKRHNIRVWEVKLAKPYFKHVRGGPKINIFLCSDLILIWKRNRKKKVFTICWNCFQCLKYIKTNQMFFSITVSHNTPTMTWQHYWISSYLSGFSWEVSTSCPPLSPDQKALIFSCGASWKIISAYKPEELEGSNTNSNCKILSVFTAKCLLPKRIFRWCGQVRKQSKYWTCIRDAKTFELLFTTVCV
jgi:hypothetical protein